MTTTCCFVVYVRTRARMFEQVKDSQIRILVPTLLP
jgi:hypothetical protein